MELNNSYKRALMRPTLACAKDSSLTKQSFKDECDINNIVKKHKATGLITHLNERSAQYGDVSNVADYTEAMNIVVAAREAFEVLPATLRKRFNNDPVEYLAFVENPENHAEAIKLGMMNERTEPTPPVSLVKIVSDEPVKDAS